MGVYVELRGLQILSQSLERPDDGGPLDQQSPNRLWRTPSAEALDLPAKDVPVARGLAQERIQSLVAVLQDSEEVDVKLVDGAAPPTLSRCNALHSSSASAFTF